MKILSYDEIVKNNKTEKDSAGVSKSSRAKIQSKLQQMVSTAEVKQIEAEEKFEQSVISGEGIDTSALEMKKSQDTLEFYQSIYKGLFPSAASAVNS